ncbi:ABC transporter ATP-binding protein [Longispora sp. NPDC051575]|uniref:ABC transporter ATP-binding protein n=1 Tax=Longispora sp. NPDC051575 TaxID=3154943 RepID=UPI003437E9E5
MQNVIEVRGLRKRYGAQHAVRDVTFEVGAGEIFGIVGPNGAGKTTTVECVVGLREPDAGTVRVLGLDRAQDARELRERVGIQLQSSELPAKLTVGEALRLYTSFYRKPADWRVLLTDWGLADKERTAFGKLSGGQKQRLSIALALAGTPEVVILDELTTGLDPQARREAWGFVERLRAGGVTVVLVSHFMEEVERLCDRVAVISAGRIVAVDTPAGLVRRAGGDQVVRFRPTSPLDDALLTALPEVRSVERAGPQVTVSGTGNLPGAVTAVLARHGIVAAELRIEQASLDDAYATLTTEREKS